MSMSSSLHRLIRILCDDSPFPPASTPLLCQRSLSRAGRRAQPERGAAARSERRGAQSKGQPIKNDHQETVLRGVEDSYR